MRPVALLYIVTTVAVILTVSACGSTPASSPSTKSTASQPSAAADAGPGASRKCDQNTRAEYVPDTSEWAPLPGGAPTFRDFIEKLKAIKAKGVFSPVVDASNPLIGPVHQDMVDAVICPNGLIYKLGDAVPWAHSARLLNANPNGKDVTRGLAGLYSHPANEVIQAPCPAALLRLHPDKRAQSFYGVCLNNGATYETPVLDPALLMQDAK